MEESIKVCKGGWRISTFHSIPNQLGLPLLFAAQSSVLVALHSWEHVGFAQNAMRFKEQLFGQLFTCIESQNLGLFVCCCIVS